MALQDQVSNASVSISHGTASPVKLENNASHVFSRKAHAFNYTLWHHRLGHAPMSKLMHILALQMLLRKHSEVCLTCPMAKFTKLTFPMKEGKIQQLFELVTWTFGGLIEFLLKENSGIF